MAVRTTERKFKRLQKKHLDQSMRQELPDLADELLNALKTINSMKKTITRLDKTMENISKRLFNLEMKHRDGE